jgi:hypothetical protein
MIRRLLPSALCIFLSPLLVAQQTAQPATSPTPASPASTPPQITLSSDAAIHIVTPSDVALAKIKPGTTVRFFSDSDVIVNGVKVIPALTPVEGVVEKVIHASRFRNRHAEVFIQVSGSVAGAAPSILLRCSIPARALDDPWGDDSFGYAISGVLTTFAIIAVLFLVLALMTM